MVAFNASDEALDDGGFTGMEGQVSVDMHGTNGRQVGFNSLGLQALVAEGGDPFQDGCLGGGEDGVVCVEELGVESNKFDERFLTGIVGRSSGGREAVPKKEGGVTREVSVRLIPVLWGLGEEG